MSAELDEAAESQVPAPEMDDDDESAPCEFEKIATKSSLERASPVFSKENLYRICCPHGCTTMAIPLLLSTAAFLLTGIGSYRCTYFQGASISFTGGNYGIWTLEDTSGKCQLWDVLFFSYSLGAPLIAARILSMAALLFGLAMLTTMTQALQLHAASWGLGLFLTTLLLVSLSTTSIMNMWAVFWLFTYVIFILIVRYLFIHPIHRLISSRGHKIIAGVLFVCAMCSLLTLVVLKSEFCQCENLSAANLAGRHPGSPCDQECKLGFAGYAMVVSSALWILSAWAVLRFGIQPDEVTNDMMAEMYDHYPVHSITTRAARALQKARQKARVYKATGSTEVGMGVVDGEGNEARVDSRGWRAKICCDFRVIPRNRAEIFSFWTFRVALGILVIIWVFVILLMLGSRIENTNAAKAPDTSPNFITDDVCAFDPSDPSAPFETFPSKEEAANQGYLVAHCGACGYCSNPPDILRYVETRKTVAKMAKKCGKDSVLGGYDKLTNCLLDNIGFSLECTKCWADNMVSTRDSCLFSCMTTLFTGFMADNNVKGVGDRGWLNQCLFCDEKLSGPEFVKCSGVARRRLGIHSEIERNPAELCSKADVDWLEVHGNVSISAKVNSTIPP